MTDLATLIERYREGVAAYHAVSPPDRAARALSRPALLNKSPN